MNYITTYRIRWRVNLICHEIYYKKYSSVMRKMSKILCLTHLDCVGFITIRTPKYYKDTLPF